MEELVKALLDELRSRIDAIDHHMVHLLEERMQVVTRISEIKAKHEIAVLDAGREKIVLENIRHAIKDETYESYLLEVFQGIMAASRAYQQQRISEQCGDAFSRIPAKQIKKFCLLGEKLSHSRSPEIHETWFAHYSIPGTYTLLEKKREELPGVIPQLQKEGYVGLNVTIPYKTDIMHYVDELTPEAQNIGAVNTISLQGKVVGHNTDYAGFGHLVDSLHLQKPVKTAAVLGTGGSSRAVISWLLDHGVEVLTLVSRDPEEASLKWLGLHTVGYDTFTCEGIDLLVNTTPVGMFPKEDACPISQEQLQGAGAVLDLIYNPIQTRLLRMADHMQIPSQNGLLMLVAQALEAQAFWLKIPYRDADTQFIMKSMLHRG